MITFITVKGESKRCPRKNHKLLPYVLEQVHQYLDVVVITDSLELQRIAEKYNVKVFIEDKEIQHSELHSIYNYLVQTKQLNSIKEFVHLPVTQPFRSDNLIMTVAYADIKDYDFATSYVIIPNRKIFLLNDDNTYQEDSFERKGSLCVNTKMIDGSIYKIQTSFLEKIIQTNNVNHAFWNESKIKFYENENDICLDIDTNKDLKLFLKIKDVI